MVSFPSLYEMKNIIIAVTLTLVIALSPMITGCPPNYDRIIADSTKALEKNPDERKATMTRLSPTAPRP
jgi:coenzyme F420-reducing hydrogenase gamma subunit